MEHPSTVKQKRIRVYNKWSGLVCKCGGTKSGQAAECKACQLSAKRPPVDTETYFDSEGLSYRRVPCTMHQYALVSAARYEAVMAHLWVANFDPSIGDYYVVTTIDRKRVKLHRFIAGDPLDKFVDHRNHKTLDCRDGNLRVADDSESACHRRLRRDNTSGFKGVWFRKERNRWVGMVTCRGKDYFTKHCRIAIDAAIEYNKLALELHGEFACLNKIPSESGQSTESRIADMD